MLSHFDEIFGPSGENLSSSNPFILYDLFKGNDDEGSSNSNENNDNRSSRTFVQRLVDGIIEMGNLWQSMNPIRRLS